MQIRIYYERQVTVNTKLAKRVVYLPDATRAEESTATDGVRGEERPAEAFFGFNNTIHSGNVFVEAGMHRLPPR